MKRIFYYLLHEFLHWYARNHPAVRLQQWWKAMVAETLDDWADVKTQQTMLSVDAQIETIVEPSGVDAPVYEEKPSEVDGLPEMSLSAPWSKNDRNF